MNSFSKALVDWYKRHGRDLPWRHTVDPYRVWVSEIILQQTRVEQGRDYYRRFIDRFPDVGSLARADEDEVMRLWQGLGYYSRARHLHQAARSLLPHCRMPRTYEGIRALPGVGDYTAAAICSLAYGMPRAVVDGNVYRVLSRYLGIDTPIDSTAGRRLFADLAQELLDPACPALHNQAMMDLGATVCTPRGPLCDECPLCDSCLALAQGRVEQLPVKAHRTRVSDRYLHYIIVRDIIVRGGEGSEMVRAGEVGDSLLLRRREGDDIWRGLWELPLVEADHALSLEELLRHPDFRAFLADGSSSDRHDMLCADVPAVRVLAEGVKHVLTHRVLHVNFYELTLPRDSYNLLQDSHTLSQARHSFQGYKRVPIADLPRYGLPALLRGFLQKYL